MLRFCGHYRKTTELATAGDGDITKLIMVLREHPILALTCDRLYLKPFPFTNSFVPLNNHREEGIISTLQSQRKVTHLPKVTPLIVSRGRI